MTFMERCPYKYYSDCLLKQLRLFLCKISITLIVRLLFLLQEKDMKNENVWHFNYVDYNGRYRNECPGSYGDFCDFCDF